MEEEKDVLESSPEVEETPEAEADLTPKVEEKTVPYKRFKEVNDELSKLKTQPAKVKSLDVEDYINISASLEGLDQREKEYLASQHKMSGKPITEIRKDEDFNLWQKAYRLKVEENKTLKPSGGQPEVEIPKSAKDILKSGTIQEKEELLKKFGMIKEVKPRPDKVIIR